MDDIREVDLNGPSEMDMESTSLRPRIDWNFSENVGLTYLASYNTLDRDQDISGRVGSSNTHEDSENDSSSHELQLKSLDLESPLEWIVDAFYFEENSDVDFVVDVNPFFGVYFQLPERTTEAIALRPGYISNQRQPQSHPGGAILRG